MRFSVKLWAGILFIVIAVSGMAYAGDSYRHNNSIFLDLGGNGLFVSANYSRALMHSSGYFLSMQIGVGTALFFGGTTIPHQITLNFGRNKSFLEAGVGGTFWFGNLTLFGTEEKYAIYIISPVFGYRYQFKKGFTFRIYLNPLIPLFGVDKDVKYKPKPFGGLSVGYSF